MTGPVVVPRRGTHESNHASRRPSGPKAAWDRLVAAPEREMAISGTGSEVTRSRWRKPPGWTRGRSGGTTPASSTLFTAIVAIAAALRVSLTEPAWLPPEPAVGPDAAAAPAPAVLVGFPHPGTASFSPLSVDSLDAVKRLVCPQGVKLGAGLAHSNRFDYFNHACHGAQEPFTGRGRKLNTLLDGSIRVGGRLLRPHGGGCVVELKRTDSIARKHCIRRQRDLHSKHKYRWPIAPSGSCSPKEDTDVQVASAAAHLRQNSG